MLWCHMSTLPISGQPDTLKWCLHSEASGLCLDSKWRCPQAIKSHSQILTLFMVTHGTYGWGLFKQGNISQTQVWARFEPRSLALVGATSSLYWTLRHWNTCVYLIYLNYSLIINVVIYAVISMNFQIR